MSSLEPSWLSLVPPLLAIVTALVLRRVVVSLGVGVVLGAFVVHHGEPLASLWAAVRYVAEAALDSGHQWILAFALALGALMRLLSESGGGLGVSPQVLRFASNRLRGQTLAWAMGLVFFFDDYANTLFVGSSMGPLRKRLQISREKLAFIVDATAAPVASIAPISTWIAVELGYIADQCAGIGLQVDAYAIFLETLPNRFYPVLMLFFGLVLALTGRDFGAMARAEQHAADQGGSAAAQPSANADERSSRAGGRRPGLWVTGLPIGLVLLSVVAGIYVTGRAASLEAGEPLTLRNILSNASSSKAMVVASLIGGVCAVVLLSRRAGSGLKGVLGSWGGGALSMLPVLGVLLLAWSLGAVCRDLKTAQYLVGVLGADFNAGLLPSAVFLVSALVSFATGTSWGTMGIVFPLAVPLAHSLLPGDQSLLVGTISAILAGSVFGDHCSPISDTTIMSALATQCDQVAHVRTQLPYALLVALVSLLLGSLATGIGLWGSGVALASGALVLYIVVRVVGRVPASADTSGAR